MTQIRARFMWPRHRWSLPPSRTKGEVLPNGSGHTATISYIDVVVGIYEPGAPVPQECFVMESMFFGQPIRLKNRNWKITRMEDPSYTTIAYAIPRPD